MTALTQIYLYKAAEVVADELIKTQRWWKFAEATGKREKAFIPVLVKLFKTQQADVLANLADNPPPGKSIIKLTPDEYVAEMFDPEEWNTHFEVAARPHVRDALIAAGKEAVEEVTTGLSFNVTNPRVAAFINSKVVKFSKEVNQTTRDYLKREFVAGLAEGEGIPQLRKRVQKVFENATKARAEMIARTEIIGSSNYGAMEGYKQAKVPKKAWLATRDTVTRDEHRNIDGEEVGIDEKFSNGLRYPGDPSGPPESVINCRCTILPLVEGA